MQFTILIATAFQKLFFIFKGVTTMTKIPKSQRPYVIRRVERGREETIASGSLNEMLEFLSWCLTDRCRPRSYPGIYSILGINAGQWIKLDQDPNKSTVGITGLMYRIANNDADYSEITPADMAKVYAMVENHKACTSERTIKPFC
jgi:hypothetical protein